MEDNIKKVLAGAGFNFKKQFGQNFLTDAHLLDSIVDLSGAEGCDVVEIGCGAGTLTRALAKKAAFVHAYEIDRSLQPVLSQTLAGLDNVEVTFRDFLKLRLDVIERELPPYRVVANLPYYITTPLIMMILEHSNKCLSLTVMVQEEVAQRFCAEAGTPEYGAVTAAIALRGVCSIVRHVSRNMFTPKPNVDSAVVHIEIKEGNVPVKDAALYKKVVRAAFSSRRKTLENNLMQAFGLKREDARNLLESCGVEEKARGEELSPLRFAALADKLLEVGLG